jgi:hypothetical protein
MQEGKAILLVIKAVRKYKITERINKNNKNNNI